MEGYAEMSDETFTRRFHGDRADLAKIGVDITVLSGAEAGQTTDAQQLYFLSQEDFRLPAVDFTPAELRALSLSLAALDGRFAYARPLRLALTAILRGQNDGALSELEQLPIALAPDEDARRVGKQLSRLEEAVTRGKTICFSYPIQEGSLPERTLDSYGLFLIQSHWYVVGYDHDRAAIRTFRVTRIRGPVRFLTGKTRDFTVPSDYDPRDYGARPPWMLGPVRGTATVRVGDDLAWWVQRLEPHIVRQADDTDGCCRFTMAYSDELILLSWVVGLGGCGELIEPPALRGKLRELLTVIFRNHQNPPAACHRIEPMVDSANTTRSPSVAHVPEPEDESAPVAPEHLARAMTLLYYLVDERRPDFFTWATLENDLGLTQKEIETDLSLINLVNYGGGTYVLSAEAGPDGVSVVRDVMADTFSQPARLSPVMASALLLALDLMGNAFSVEGLDSLASVREKVQTLIGTKNPEGAVTVDELLSPDPIVVGVLNHAIRDRIVVELDYFTATRQELNRRLVEPYLLFRSPDGWYLEAYCLRAQAQRTFKLSRIKVAEATDKTFVPRPEVDLILSRRGQAFVPNEMAAWAVVRFHPRWRTYLEDSGMECVACDDGRLEVRMPYADERWLAQEVLRFLGDAVLEQPMPARQRVRDLAKVLLVRYGSDNPASPSASAAVGES